MANQEKRDAADKLFEVARNLEAMLGSRANELALRLQLQWIREIAADLEAL